MTPRERVEASLAASDREGQAMCRRGLTSRQEVSDEMPHLFEVDGLESDFLADLLQWAADRRNDWSDGDRAMAMELRERVRLPHRDRRTFMGLPREIGAEMNGPDGCGL
jgi:hypothetical protein